MIPDSEERLGAILRTAVEGIVTIDESGVISSINGAAERLFGYSSEEVIGRNVRILMPPPYFANHDRYIADYIATGQKKIIGIGREVVGRHQDGNIFPMYLSVGEFRLGDRRFFIGIVRDISTEKRIQESLQQSESRLRAIFDTAVEGIITIDQHGIVNSANPAATRMFGYVDKELIGQNVKILAAPPACEKHDDYLANYLSTGESTIVGGGREVVGRRKDGTTFSLYISVGEMRVGDVPFFTGMLRDLTEEKRIRQREAEMGRILENSVNEIYLFDAETLRFILVNRGARDNLGYSLEELRGMTPLDLKPGYDRTRFEEMISSLRDGGEQITFETTHQRKDGSTYAVEVHLQYADMGGRPAVVAIILDVTQRKQTEQRLLQSERLAAIGQVVSGVAHESRNALQRIQAAVDMAKFDSRESPDLLEQLSRIEAAAEHLRSLNEEVRDYAAPITPDIQECYLASVWRTAWNHVVGLRQGIRGELIEQIVGDTKCLTDPFRMDQVFRNLFENALDACHDPTGVSVTCSQDRRDGIDWLRVAVRDNGSGLDAVQRRRVFEAFYTTKPRGTGLGMAIAKRLIEAQGGEISVGDGENGAEFIIMLPRGIC